MYVSVYFIYVCISVRGRKVQVFRPEIVCNTDQRNVYYMRLD